MACVTLRLVVAGTGPPWGARRGQKAAKYCSVACSWYTLVRKTGLAREWTWCTLLSSPDVVADDVRGLTRDFFCDQHTTRAHSGAYTAF
jgi:hypothetical protein